MGMLVDPDNSAFQVALNSEIYDDKTGLLEYTNKVMNTLQGYVCNSHLRRFGKSITANMLTSYYSRGRDLDSMFSDLKIATYPNLKNIWNWSETASYDGIVSLINMNFDGLKTAIIEMLSGSAVEVDVGSFQNDIESIVNKDDVLTYLIHLGYLAYFGKNRTAYVPNEEIRQELQNCFAANKG